VADYVRVTGAAGDPTSPFDAELKSR